MPWGTANCCCEHARKSPSRRRVLGFFPLRSTPKVLGTPPPSAAVKGIFVGQRSVRPGWGEAGYCLTVSIYYRAGSMAYVCVMVFRRGRAPYGRRPYRSCASTGRLEATNRWETSRITSSWKLAASAVSAAIISAGASLVSRQAVAGQPAMTSGARYSRLEAANEGYFQDQDLSSYETVGTVSRGKAEVIEGPVSGKQLALLSSPEEPRCSPETPFSRVLTNVCMCGRIADKRLY